MNNETMKPDENLDQTIMQEEATAESAPRTEGEEGINYERELLILQKEVEKLNDRLKEENDRFLHITTEYDNYKKRTQKEKEELYTLAKSDVIIALLPVIDNMERAGQCKDFEQLSEGVNMVLSQFVASLEKIGVTEIEALDQPFDPTLHDAVFHETVEGAPENTVTTVLQKGYIAGDRVIRHALVKVVN